MGEVKKLAQATVRKPYGPEISLACWHYSFANIFLAEYYLITGDRSVLPEIRRMSTLLVKGQGPMGTWGHTFAEYDKDRLRGYGAVNAAGLPVSISLVLARECGLKFKGLDEAIEESSTFFRRHVGIGAIPYGDGPPNLQFGHDDNGKNSAAAILFSLLGDEKSTRYYARTALACYGRDREQGHTGNFWNMLWAMPAVSLGGPQATLPLSIPRLSISAWEWLHGQVEVCRCLSFALCRTKEKSSHFRKGSDLPAEIYGGRNHGYD